ncbi:MAG: hypothetical protein ACTSXD_05070 [Candidatus Heimdallarchaeaceae archaeon]
MEQENKTTRMVCDDCSLQFETNEPDRWDMKQVNGQTIQGEECPNPGCQSHSVHKVE